MGRKKIEFKDKQAININFRLKPKDAATLRVATKLEGDKNVSAFIWRVLIPFAESVVEKQRQKVVANENV